MVNWKISTLCSALIGAATATTAPGFPVSGGSPDLNATWAGNNVSPPGELIPRRDTATVPDQITTPVWTQLGRAVLMMVDTDVPRNGTRVQLLHWLTANVTLPSTDTQILKLPSPDVAAAPYLQPSPPVGDIPHKYTLLLFAQPKNFTIPARFNEAIKNRVGWDASAFVNATGLGAPLAATWIRVQNKSGEIDPTTAVTSMAPGATGNATRPSLTPSDYPGAASAVEAGAWSASLAVVFGAGLMGLLL